jgi:hypothetical protein
MINTLSLKENNFNDCYGTNILIIGNSGCGKTLVIRKLLDKLMLINNNLRIFSIGRDYEHPNFNITTVNNNYEEFIKTDIYNSVIIHKDIHSYSSPSPWTKKYNYSDDNSLTPLTWTKKYNYSDDNSLTPLTWFEKIIMNGHNKKVTNIVTTQSDICLSPIIRQNFDKIIIFHPHSLKIEKRLYDNYFGIFPTFDTFKHILNHVCIDYGFLSINNRINKNNISDMITWGQCSIALQNDTIIIKNYNMEEFVNMLLHNELTISI